MQVKKYFLLLIILLIASINFNLFLKPLKLITGGTQGISIIINNIVNIRYSTIIFIINLFMLFLSFLFLKKETTISTIISTLLYPFFIHITSFLSFSFKIEIINVIITGIISGITNGIIYKLNFSSGGINLLAPIINKYFSLKLGTINFIINAIIVILGYIIFGFKNLFYSLIVIILNSILINILNKN